MKDPLSQALSDLPRHRAGDGFTEGLNTRLAQAQNQARTGRPGWATAWALAAVLILAATGLLLLPKGEAPATTATNHQKQIQALQLQTERLSDELAELRELVEAAEPVVYLGGDEHLGILLPRDSPRGAIPTPVRVLPAAHGGSSPQHSLLDNRL